MAQVPDVALELWFRPGSDLCHGRVVLARGVELDYLLVLRAGPYELVILRAKEPLPGGLRGSLGGRQHQTQGQGLKETEQEAAILGTLLRADVANDHVAGL